MPDNNLPFNIILKNSKKKIYDSVSAQNVNKFLSNLSPLIQSLLPVEPAGYWTLKPSIESLLIDLPGDTFEERVILLKALMFELIEYQINNNYYILNSSKLHDESILRFTTLIETNINHDTHYYSLLNDAFIKEFALCTGKLISTGLLVFDITKFSKSSIIENIPHLPYFIKIKILKQFIEAHLDDTSHRDFSAETWAQSYFLASEMLRLSPELQGIFGRCWFYDPILANKITPKLKFASHLQLDNGAKLLQSKPLQSDIDLATLRSKTRQDLYNKGLYSPRGYIIVWDRESVLKWAQPKTIS